MSKIALTGNASGSGTFTLAAPNSDTDRTLTLPDEAGTVLTSGGVMADTWRITTDITGTSDQDITANLERSDTYGSGYVGTGMTQSSGVFTFPSTGVYLVTAQAYINASGGPATYTGLRIKTTTNGGSTYNNLGLGYGAAASTGHYQNVFISIMFDVTNTSTHKVLFNFSAS